MGSGNMGRNKIKIRKNYGKKELKEWVFFYLFVKEEDVEIREVHVVVQTVKLEKAKFEIQRFIF